MPTTTANDRQPMIFYSCLIVAVALSRLVFEILTMFSASRTFWPLLVPGNTATLIGELKFLHGVSYRCSVVNMALKCVVLS